MHFRERGVGGAVLTDSSSRMRHPDSELWRVMMVQVSLDRDAGEVTQSHTLDRKAQTNIHAPT